MIKARDILNKIKGVDQAEVFLSSSKTLKIDVIEARIEAVEEIADIGCGIRVIQNNKLGFAYTSEFDGSVLEETIKQALANARNTEEDDFNSLPAHAHIPEDTNLDLFDPEITKTPIKDKIKLALAVEAAAYKYSDKVSKTEKITYSDSEVEVAIANSNGLSSSYKANYCGALADVIAGLGDGMEAGFGLSFVKKFSALDPKEVGSEAALRATQMLGAKSIPSQKLPLVIEPHVATQILEVLAFALSSDAVQKGRSLFIGKLGQSVGSNLLTIVDNGRMKNGLDSAPFDAEGVPTQETKLITNGKLSTYIYNTYTANKDKKNSTGNAVRPSFKGLPGVGTTNLYIQPGKTKPEAIIGGIKKGLYITRVMGIHTANPISGEFSVGAQGIMIENGKKTYPVRGITIAGNLIDMFKNLEAVGSDLRFIADVGSPTLLIHDMTVSGH